MNLNGNRYKERYKFKRVAWANWQEHETYDYITDGSIELATDTDLVLTGSFKFEGYDTPKENDLLRVYYSFEDDEKERFNSPLATMLVSFAELNLVDTVKGIKSSGTITGSSVLKVLKDRCIPLPMTISKNENPVYFAKNLIEDSGLMADAEPTSYVMGKSYTFDAGTNYLEIVNTCMGFASYTNVFPDAMGRIQLKSYNETWGKAYSEYVDFLAPEDILYPDDNLYPEAERIVSNGLYFANDDNSIMYPEVKEANDWQNTPNVVYLLYNTPDACISAQARNITGSRASLDSRGREIVHFKEVSDIGTGNRLNNMRTLAENTLKEKSSDIEYVTMAHAYVPMYIYDPIKIKYGENEWTGNVETMKVNLSPSTKTETRLKRVLTQDIEIIAEAKVVR